uniref:Uncharacterized protein n=1 Tax=Arundo donax TaxID=35708 RepID=A0A0A9BTC7_ARUDO
MASSTEAPPPLLPVTLFLLPSSLHGARAAPNTDALSVLCNGASYGAGDPFAASLAYVLSVTPARDGHDFYNISPYPMAFA